MTNSNMTCEAFDAALPDYLEGALDDSLRAAVEMHLRECVRCAGLVRDIENIRKEAAALPDLVPSRDLWQGIDSRIAAPVIPLAARPERQTRVVPVWMGVAAAALIVSTAGITYQLTARSLRSSAEGRVGETATPQNMAQSGNASVPAANVTVPEPAGGVVASSSVDAGDRSSGTTRTAAGQPSTVLARMASRNQQNELAYSDRVYGKEIAALQRIVSQRKTQLDSSTVAIIEKNLQIIDNAIEQSRAALEKDPASLLLSEQLTHALDKKVELLRTAALLPAST
jgi:anti-sigma factor RsiW